MFQRVVGPHILVVAAVALTSIGCEKSLRDCSTEDASAAGLLPDRLSETGLYADISTKEISERAILFSPRFPLWTDGAEKRRWLILPEGEPIDTSDNDNWIFPQGTTFYKEFALNGVLLETRVNQLVAGRWAAASYIWSEDESEATHTAAGGQDVLGTNHDVPNSQECLACHAGRRNFSLGFSATQLSEEDRASLFADGLMTNESLIAHNIDPEVLEGLGVLHGNCAHCHNAERNAMTTATECYAPPTDQERAFDFTLPAQLVDLYDAPALVTAAEQLGTRNDSRILRRMSDRNLEEENPSMPPLGTEIVDDEGITAVETMLERLAELDASD